MFVKFENLITKRKKYFVIIKWTEVALFLLPFVSLLLWKNVSINSVSHLVHRFFFCATAPCEPGPPHSRGF